MRIQLVAALLALFSTPTLADTFVVDSQFNPGADFHQVQEAVDSALVQSGDVLLIRAGQYETFTTSKGLTIYGLGGGPLLVYFQGATPSTFENCSDPIRIERVRFQHLKIVNCRGPIHILNTFWWSLVLDHARGVFVENKATSFIPGSVVARNGTRADFLFSRIEGEGGAQGEMGGTGLTVEGGSQVRLANCNITGGHGGGSSSSSPLGGDGGRGVLVTGSSSVQLIGTQGNFIRGGLGGFADNPRNDGSGGTALEVEALSSVRLSNYMLIGGWNPEGTAAAPDYSGAPGDLTIATLHDPLLLKKGSFKPGETSAYEVHGDPNSLAILFLGTTTTSLALPQAIGLLSTDLALTLWIGNLDASGQHQHDLFIPPMLPLEVLAMVQAGVLFSTDGSQRLSNPSTLVAE